MANSKINSDKNILDKIVLIFQKESRKPFNYKQILKKLGSEGDISSKTIIKALNELKKQKIISEESRGKYKINPEHVKSHDKKSYITGVVDMKLNGKAYVISSECEEDILILPGNTNRALHGDTVKVYLFPKRTDRKPEGEIVEIVKREKTHFVGVVQISKRFAFLIPDNANVPIDIFIPLTSLKGAQNGEKAIAVITDWPAQSKNPFGEIIQVLGKPGDNEVEMNSILIEYDFPIAFPKDVELFAERIPINIPQKEIDQRKDFRKITTFTIDPKDAKDFDDAISLKSLPNGNWEVGVHIADVSYYVPEDSILDKEAYNRGTSVYLVDRCIPMLPEKLSNNVCSLRPNEDKLCFSAVFEMNGDARILNEWFGKTIICSDRRFNYDEVQEIIESGKGDFSEEISLLNQLAKKLRDERFKNGSIAFERAEVRFELDEKGKPIGVFLKEQKDSHKLIEDFMLLANRKVAEYIGKRKQNEKAKTFVYRIHDNPSDEKLKTFTEFVGKLGYKMKLSSRKSIASSFNKLLEDIVGKGEENMIETLAIRTMAKAIYSTKNIGHYGLAFDYYTHFTSPIRRYPDLMVHRLLFSYMNNKPSVNQEHFEKLCEHSSDMEKKATEAERASIKYKQVEFLIDKVGQTFDGLISGVTKWGLFVELDESKCEGMIRLRDIDDDFYYLDEDNYCVIGQRNGKTLKLGDKVKIKIKSADLSKKQLDFVLI